MKTEDRIIITDKKIIHTYFSKLKNKPIAKCINYYDFIKCVWNYVTLKNVTLGRLFEIIKPLDGIWNTILNDNIFDYLKEMDKPIEEEKSSLDYLELYWDASVDSVHKLGIWPAFHGYGYSKEDKKKVFWAIEMSKVNTFKNTPVILNTDFCIYLEIDKKQQKIGTRDFSVLDMIKGIFWELNFFGSVEKRNKATKEINEINEQVTELKDNGTI